MDGKGLEDYFRTRFDSEHVAALDALFPVPGGFPGADGRGYSSDFYAAQRCETDYNYACNAFWLSEAAERSWIYHFVEPTYLGLALHAAEIEYVFGTLPDPTPAQAAVSANMRGWWANFAKAGDPNGAGLPAWPAWADATGFAVLNVSAAPAVYRVPTDAYPGCAWFDANYDYPGCLPGTTTACRHGTRRGAAAHDARMRRLARGGRARGGGGGGARACAGDAPGLASRRGGALREQQRGGRGGARRRGRGRASDGAGAADALAAVARAAGGAPELADAVARRWRPAPRRGRGAAPGPRGRGPAAVARLAGRGRRVRGGRGRGRDRGAALGGGGAGPAVASGAAPPWAAVLAAAEDAHSRALRKAALRVVERGAAAAAAGGGGEAAVGAWRRWLGAWAAAEFESSAHLVFPVFAGCAACFAAGGGAAAPLPPLSPPWARRSAPARNENPAVRKAFLVEFFGGRVVAPAAAPWPLVRDDALRLLDDCELRRARDVIAELDGAATAFLAAAYAAAPPATRATMASLALRGDGFSPGSNGLRAPALLRVAGPSRRSGPAVGDGDLVAAAAAVERSRKGRNASATRELLEAFVPLLCAAASRAALAARGVARGGVLAAAGPLRDAQAAWLARVAGGGAWAAFLATADARAAAVLDALGETTRAARSPRRSRGPRPGDARRTARRRPGPGLALGRARRGRRRGLRARGGVQRRADAGGRGRRGRGPPRGPRRARRGPRVRRGRGPARNRRGRRRGDRRRGAAMTPPRRAAAPRACLRDAAVLADPRLDGTWRNAAAAFAEACARAPSARDTRAAAAEAARWGVVAAVLDAGGVDVDAEDLAASLERCGTSRAAVVACLRCAFHALRAGDAAGCGRVVDLSLRAFLDCASKSPRVAAALATRVVAPAAARYLTDAAASEAFGASVAGLAAAFLEHASRRPHASRALAFGLCSAFAAAKDADPARFSIFADVAADLLLYREPLLHVDEIPDDGPDDGQHGGDGAVLALMADDAGKGGLSLARLAVLRCLEDFGSSRASARGDFVATELARRDAGLLAATRRASAGARRPGARGSAAGRPWASSSRAPPPARRPSPRRPSTRSRRRRCRASATPSRPRRASPRGAGRPSCCPGSRRGGRRDGAPVARRRPRTCPAAASSRSRACWSRSATACCRATATTGSGARGAGGGGLPPELLRLAAGLVGSSRGLVRGVAQLLVARLTEDVDLDACDGFLAVLVRALRVDPDLRRNLERQSKFFSKLRSPALCTVEGMLASGAHEYGDVVPASVVCALRDEFDRANAELNAAEEAAGLAQLLWKPPPPPPGVAPAEPPPPREPLFVQRKIDQIAVDLGHDDSDDDGARRRRRATLPGPPRSRAGGATPSAARPRGANAVVALEQATNSTSLAGDAELPSPAVLLLGREKEGVPGDLMDLCDVCVEIPQLGVVRSLNVHVSGALAIWHFARQWMARQRRGGGE
ncbi:hypothetical protein JL722_13999 [Aureococcus anophagefferens]|nr:hypothetical protein JL722_13999 [Aureococcus anophagefferens]